MKKRSWSKNQLVESVKQCTSTRQVLKCLSLKEAGGNYAQVKKYISELGLNTSHFTGAAWSKGKTGIGKPRIPLKEILVKNSYFQSFKLKKRLYKEGFKKQECEECGWHQQSTDGRVPLELDHINGVRSDNRLENLRILCPNCHSLKTTHRGKNIKKR